ncbi:MAG TPA: hypothetical protein VH092_14355 [Urbifossiella sp.]|jgi:hypothetical protein|nr:hypothetical protein [Urbifossiella sp.]
MTPTISIDIPAHRERLVRQLLTLTEELEQLALTAPDGTVLDSCETNVLTRGRELQPQLLHDAVARRIEAAEKRGRSSAPARAAGPRRTAGRNPGNS